MQFTYSKNQVYDIAYQLVDYGLYKRYLVLKYCRKKGFEKKKTFKRVTDPDEMGRISRSRAKRNIKEIVLCNDFTHFFTQTLNNNRYDLEFFVKNMRKKFKAYKRANKDFIFVVVYEKHKDGAYHLHGLLGGLDKGLYVNDYGHLSIKSFEDLGFLNLQAIRTDIEDKIKVANYVTKYITKDFLATDSGTHYFCSRGLKRAKRTFLNDLNCDNLSLVFENDFVKIFSKNT